MIRIATGALALAALAACVYVSGPSYLANAQPVSDGAELEGITMLDTSAGLNVVYTVADTYSIDVEVRRGERSDVRIEREGSTLEVGRTRQNGWGNNRLDATVTIAGPSLSTLESSSGSSATVSGISAERFSIDASSGASIRVSGTCESLDVDMSSGASVNGEDLRCTRGTVDGSSGASADLHLSELVNIDVSSGASVAVEGGARIGEADKSSGGSYSVSPAPL